MERGAGRTLRTATLDALGDPLLQTTLAYDALVEIDGYGDVLETTSTNLLGHTTHRRTDAAGRTLAAVDAGGFISTVAYDPGCP